MYDYKADGIEFKGWPKTPRLKGNPITITEKIDGTNACVIVRDGEVVGMQSRNRLIKPGDDNMGFAFWVHENREELAALLGDGYHYGEWAGPGIQKNPHQLDRKKFFLFNTARFNRDEVFNLTKVSLDVVPVLFHGAYSQDAVELEMHLLQKRADKQGYTPEGICIYFHATKQVTKMTYAHPDGKWKADA
jgi:hypothetical protein